MRDHTCETTDAHGWTRIERERGTVARQARGLRQMNANGRRNLNTEHRIPRPFIHTSTHPTSRTHHKDTKPPRGARWSERGRALQSEIGNRKSPALPALAVRQPTPCPTGTTRARAGHVPFDFAPFDGLRAGRAGHQRFVRSTLRNGDTDGRNGGASSRAARGTSMVGRVKGSAVYERM
jgi:hypothetical protein